MTTITTTGDQRIGLRATLTVILPFSFGYLISYLFRTVNSVIAPDLIGELHLDESGLGLITSTYLYAFTVFQLPLGLLLDRYGPRRVQAALLFIAGIGSLFFAMGSSVLLLAFCRAVIGLGLSGGLMAAFKANALWLPAPRVPLANSVVVAFGGLGVFAATAPADWMATHFGWRAIFYLLAVVTVFVAAVVFLGAPHGNGAHEAQKPSGNWIAQLKGLGPVFTNAMFWRIAPMVAFVTGGFIAVQSLWTARWLTDVRLLDRTAVADDLMAMAIAFSAGSLLTGLIADWAERRGIGLKAVMIGCFVVLGCAELGLVFDVPLPGWLLVTLLGISGSGANLAYVMLSGPFGPAMAGRAQTSLNLLLFLSAALIQSGIGAALDLVDAAGISGGATFHYALVLGLLVVVQVASVLWFAGMPDARR